MTTAELREATKEFDREFIGDTFRPPTPAERAGFERARKRGRPRNGQGAKTISVIIRACRLDFPRNSRYVRGSSLRSTAYERLRRPLCRTVFL
jgi:hypothetical protein